MPSLRAEMFGRGHDNGDVQEVLSHVPSPLWQEQIRARIAMGGINLWVHDEEQQLLAAGGLQWLWEHVSEGWLLVTPWGRKHPKALYGAIRGELESLRERFGLWRIQSPVRADWEEACRLLTHLGWQNEGRMQKFGPNGEDFYMYAWVRTGEADHE